jgi:hypothetical protein
LRTETLDGLIRYKADRGVATWDEVMSSLLARAELEAIG